MMDTIWTALTILIAAWLSGVAIAALIRGPQPRTVRLGRDGSAVALAILGLLAYMLILNVRPSPTPAVAAFAVGGGLGFLATWRNGSLPAFGLPVVWGSPWQVALLALSGVVTTIGALGAGDGLLNAGFLALSAAVGFGAGAYGHGVIATFDARQALDEELHPTVTCPACRKVVRAGTRLCTQCRQPLPKHCSSCGSTLVQAGVACESCGSLEDARLPEAPPDAVTVRFCHACSIQVSMNDVFCPACATLLAPACPLCGAPAMLDQEICSLCDIELGLAAAAVESGLVDKIVAEVEAEWADEELAGVIPAPEPLVEAGSAAIPPIESGRPEFPPRPAVPPQGRFCATCGTEAQPEAAFCVRCGNRFD